MRITSSLQYLVEMVCVDIVEMRFSCVNLKRGVWEPQLKSLRHDLSPRTLKSNLLPISCENFEKADKTMKGKPLQSHKSRPQWRVHHGGEIIFMPAPGDTALKFATSSPFSSPTSHQHGQQEAARRLRSRESGLQSALGERSATSHRRSVTPSFS